MLYYRAIDQFRLAYFDHDLRPSMIWVHGPRYMQVMYPDHEKPKIRRYSVAWFSTVCRIREVEAGHENKINLS
jgi:hypothetical protein